MPFIGFTINAVCTAVNVALYVDNPNPISAASGVVCGFMALFCLVLAVTR